MKLTVLFIFLSTAVFAQKKMYTMADMPYELDSATNGIVYRGVVQVHDASADQLYSRAKSFMFKNFVNANAVIQIDDKAGGILAGKGLLPVKMKGFAGAMTAGMQYETPIEIRVKDGRYRYEISNLYVVGQGQRTSIDNAVRQSGRDPRKVEMTEKQYVKYLEPTKPFTDLIESLKASMAKSDPKDF